MKIWHLIVIVVLMSIIVCGCASVPIDVPIKDNTFQAIADLKTDIQAQFKAQAEVNAKFVAGVDNSSNSKTEQNAKRDIIQTNDTVLMKFIFGKIMDKLAWIIGSVFAFLLLLFGGIWGMLKYQSVMYNKLLSAKDVWITNLIKSSDAKDKINDDWLRAKINGGGK